MGERVAVLGSSGMAGHVLALYLREAGLDDTMDIGPRKKVFPGTELCDLEDQPAIAGLLDRLKPEVLVNCTGVLVKASEERKREALWFNAYLPRLLSDLCAARRIRFIHLGTDCVFSGKSGPYREDSPRDGDDFYGRSKALGEVAEGGDLTIRTSIIGPELKAGTGLFDWFMRAPSPLSGYRRAFWSGVTTLELAKFIRHVVSKRPELRGLVHYSVPGGIDKYSLLGLIDEAMGAGKDLRPMDEPAIDKRLVSTREDLGMSPPPYSEQLRELVAWIAAHPSLYPHYRMPT
jgi:dTDP-4-dehydrorhamnose reductase